VEVLVMSHPYFTQEIARGRYEQLVGSARAARLGEDRPRRDRPRRTLRDWFDEQVRRPALALVGRPVAPCTATTCSAVSR
jgi:hypothetical protein